MNLDLQDRVALVSGGTSGIGAATVHKLCEHGARVVFTGRSVEAGRAIETEIGEEARFFRADVSNLDDVKRSTEFCHQAYGRFDILFNNAGGPALGSIEDITVEQFQYAIDLLLRSVIFSMKFAVPYMKENQWGRIVNNSSVAALRSDLGGYIYSIAKAAVSHATRLAARELGASGITVNTISPGAIATPVFYGGSAVARSAEPEHEANRSKKLKRNLATATPVQRTGMPADVASAVLYLVSEDAGFVNGHDLVIDGGMTVAGRSGFP